MRAQDPVHHAARRVAAHHGEDAVTGQVVGADTTNVLVSVQEAFANPRAPFGLEGGSVSRS